MNELEVLGRNGHHPDPLTDAEVEIERLEGLLSEAIAGLNRALMFNTCTPEGLSIKRDVRHVLDVLDREMGGSS